ncbi:hypothetical protein CDS [Bradyrhizobium sp.]|nr:hypothetical protein CDS [Bradyrhizobium sp.]
MVRGSIIGCAQEFAGSPHRVVQQSVEHPPVLGVGEGRAAGDAGAPLLSLKALAQAVA